MSGCKGAARAALIALVLIQCLMAAHAVITCTGTGASKTCDVTCTSGQTYTNFDPKTGGTVYCAELNGGTTACDSGMTSDIIYSVEPAGYSDVSFVANTHSQAPITMVIGSGTMDDADQATPLVKAQFWPQTDEFSMIEIKDSFFANMDPDDPSTYNYLVKFEFQGLSTPPVRLAQKIGNTLYYVPYWTVVIKLEKGKVVGIRYDSSCQGCAYQCIDSACPVTYEACKNHEDDLDCTLKAYVAWEGTDKNGDYLLSAQRTIRNFRSFSASFAVDVAGQIYQKIKDNIPKPPNFTPPTLPDIPGL